MTTNKIKPIDGQRVGHLYETDQITLFDIAVKLNEVIEAVNKLNIVRLGDLPAVTEDEEKRI